MIKSTYAKKVLFLFLLLSVCQFLEARIVYRVHNQQDFDSINILIHDAIKKGENNINVYMASGTFVIRDNHIRLEDVINPRLKIKIKGNKTILVPDGVEYHSGDQYDGIPSPLDCWMANEKSINNWSHVRYADGLVEIVNKEEKLCRLKTKETLNNNFEVSAYILIPHWFQSSFFRIDYIDNNYIYFHPQKIKASVSKASLNINDDYNILKKTVRYKIWNLSEIEGAFHTSNGKIYLDKVAASLRQGIAQRLFSVEGCKINSITISGIEFRGASNRDDKPAFFFESTTARSINFEKCTFNGFRNDVISFSDVINCSVKNCTFKNCWSYCIKSDNLCENTTIANNEFEFLGEAMQNTTAVLCRGLNYVVKDNIFRDYGYGGISAGVWYGDKQLKDVCGIIQNNQFYFTKEYFEQIDNYAIMDGGAIYLFTKHNETIVRGNLINGYTGMASNRGIFCDDGAYNIQIYGNVILNTPNYYSIDSRRVRIVEQLPESGIKDVNYNILIKGNIVDGGILFYGNENFDNCYYGGNFVVANNNGREIATNNVNIEESDITLATVNNNITYILLSWDDYKVVRKSKYWKWLRSYLQTRF